MHKFFAPNGILDGKIVIEGDDFKHMTGVLRLRCGEEVLISDGKGHEYISRIETLEKKQAICTIIESFESKTESPVKVTLYQGLPKSQKMDLIVQKCTELGIVKIQPVITSRVVVKTNDKGLSSKLDRWRKIAVEASKQSNRGEVPEIGELIDFKDAVRAAEASDIAVIPYEKECGMGLKSLLRQSSGIKSVSVFIGPEGGFEEDEIAFARESGVHPITLGPRILRTETAGFTTLACILYEIGDLGGSI